MERALGNSPPYPCPDLDNEWRAEDIERARLRWPRHWRDGHRRRLGPGGALLLALALSAAVWLLLGALVWWLM